MAGGHSQDSFQARPPPPTLPHLCTPLPKTTRTFMYELVQTRSPQPFSRVSQMPLVQHRKRVSAPTRTTFRRNCCSLPAPPEGEQTTVTTAAAHPPTRLYSSPHECGCLRFSSQVLHWRGGCGRVAVAKKRVDKTAER